MYSNVLKDGEWRTRKINLWAVFKSFISQIKTGQDLTKISLPSELCFPYSMLEVMGMRELSLFHVLYPINEKESAHDRFLVVIAYFLSMLRQETSDKKPWNPVLGETHFCYTENDAKFISEQVSHHPPISAFHVVCEKQNLTIDANVSFSVKFGGNSVTVSTTGGATLEVKKFNEVYTMSRCIPDMLVNRVVWGTKYIMWVGTCVIKCESTGYECTLNFKEGSGKVNLVEGVVKHNGELIYNIEGVCGGKSFYSTKSSKTLLIDVENQKIYNPLYLPAELLDETSSVIVWGKVNQQLIENRVDKADEEKMIVENHQRALRREREQKGIIFEPRYFSKSDDGIWRLKPNININSLFEIPNNDDIESKGTEDVPLNGTE